MSTGEIEAKSAGRTSAGPRGRWKKRVLALGLSTLLAFALAELAVRAMAGAPLVERLPILRVQANPHRGWEMIPSEDHYTYQHLVHVNALGLRGSEIGAKQPGGRCPAGRRSGREGSGGGGGRNRRRWGKEPGGDSKR